MNLFLFYIWCASVAGDEKTYLVVAENKDAAFASVPLFMRQDWEVRYASLDESIDLGAEYICGDVVEFENKFFEFKDDKMVYVRDAIMQHHPHCNNPARCNAYQGHCALCQAEN